MKNTVKFDMLPDSLASVLKSNNIDETALFSHETDLYVGVSDMFQYAKIKGEIEFPNNAKSFRPQAGSDMAEHFEYGMEIPFALMDYKISQAEGKTTIKGAELINVTLDFYCIVELGSYDFGALTLENEGRNFVYDVVQSSSVNHFNEFLQKETHTTITLLLEVDLDTFPKDEEYNYLLKAEDLHESSLTATLYIGSEYEIEPESMTAFFSIEEKTTKAINVTAE